MRSSNNFGLVKEEKEEKTEFQSGDFSCISVQSASLPTFLLSELLSANLAVKGRYRSRDFIGRFLCFL